MGIKYKDPRCSFVVGCFFFFGFFFRFYYFFTFYRYRTASETQALYCDHTTCSQIHPLKGLKFTCIKCTCICDD